jgi:hypothetical protein
MIRHTVSSRVIIGLNFHQNYSKQLEPAMQNPCLTTAKTSYKYCVKSDGETT